MEWMAHFQSWVALGTLTALEIVLGIDNIIFISVLVGRLPQDRRNRARVAGLALAMVSRILLLLSLTWVMGLKSTLFTLISHDFSGRDLILVGGLNVYPREVELALTSHPAVAEAAVVGVPDPIRGEAPKTFVILRNGERVSPQDLLQWCRQRLANYKVPRSVAVVEDLPRTVTGKVLKTAIRSTG
jgi:acyl-CoA synthetase (AMP-forming)/AMP-acid ligase II